MDLEEWLRTRCSGYEFDIKGVFRRAGSHEWPVVAHTAEALETSLAEGGHLLPLPKEPAALANVLEVSIVDFVLAAVAEEDGAEGQRGTERGYPDIEISGSKFGGGFHAVDVKVARRKINKNGAPSGQTQSRITLYTGNTYFRYPTLKWPGTFRPFNEYKSHLDIIGIYTLDEQSAARVVDLELIVQPPWKIASKKRSSTTREYLGAVMGITDLREGRGEFDTPEEFYTYWRKYKFKIGDVVQKQLDKLLQAHDPATQLTLMNVDRASEDDHP
ncbi:restriction endonuclease [Actinophytocola xanthii]|uniref:Restriction endonuclease n=1 Tax=Actinophytocola xanthii TaxID=1912961 RepID=A0A1Q8CRU8_9PSEU|nr:restriction endonuclease [Actinophytocola xanthii]